MSFLNSRRKARKRWNKTGFTWSWPGTVLGEKDMLNLVLTLSFVTLPCFMPKINWIVQKVIVFFPERTAWKVSKYGVVSVPYFPVFGVNTGKYGPKKPPYLDTFHAVKGRRYRDLIIWDLRLDICIAQWLKFFQQKFLDFFVDLDYLHGETGVKVEPKVQTLGPSFFHKNSNPSKIFK